MTFFSLDKDVVEECDYVVAYISPDDLAVIKVEPKEVLHNRLGRFLHQDMIGKPFGSQIWSQDRKKHMHILRPTPELWTRSLPHRTQIIYMPDISFILEMLEVRAGSVVIESGTGSGSLSHSIARAIGKSGHLYTFDFHEQRAREAVLDFQNHCINEIVTASCQDVCNLGFGLVDLADAVFLDLPSPWMAVSHAKTSLRKDRKTRVACFSPCMEQVQRTLLELLKSGFCELELFEIVIRPIEVEEITLSSVSSTDDDISRKRPLDSTTFISRNVPDIKGHTSYLYFATLLPVSECE